MGGSLGVIVTVATITYRVQKRVVIQSTTVVVHFIGRRSVTRIEGDKRRFGRRVTSDLLQKRDLEYRRRS
mgnify:CR=1 FL=1